jgi:transposase
VSDQGVERVTIDLETINALLEHAESRLEPVFYGVLEMLAKSAISLTALLEDREMTIEKLRRMFFGSKSEKRKDLFDDAAEDSPAAESSATEGEGTEKPEGAAGDPPLEEGGESGEGERPPKKKRKGHGRNPASKYKGAKQIHISHDDLKPGGLCPEPGCTGKLYAIEPSVVIRVVAHAPFSATAWNLEQLRCGLCGKVFRASSPEDLGTEKYDASVPAMVGVLRYGNGLPHNRLDDLQADFEIPFPKSTQWDLVAGAAESVEPVYEALIHEAAQGDVLHNDDTPMKILSVIKEIKARQRKEKKVKPKEERRDDGDEPRIHLALTG